MIAQEPKKTIEQKLRRERREEYLERRRKLKKINKKLRPTTFDNHTVTEAGNFHFRYTHM